MILDKIAYKILAIEKDLKELRKYINELKQYKKDISGLIVDNLFSELPDDTPEPDEVTFKDEDAVREYVLTQNGDCDECMEYLNGLQNKDGSYNKVQIVDYLNR